MLRVYFAGAIRGGDFPGKQEAYEAICNAIRQNHILMSEHEGTFAPFKPAPYGVDERGIYQRDIDWISESQVMIADVTIPSLGVGYEIGFGLHRAGLYGILCLHHKDANVSAMILGNQNLVVKSYHTPKQASELVLGFLEELE